MTSKEEIMKDITDKVRVCRKCSLGSYRKNAVPGEGNLNAKIMFVGEAPGYSEDLQGKPFVGAAGKFLNNLLLSIGLARNEVFISNVVKCRPPQNRDPKPEEIQTCTPYLEKQIKIIAPEIIVALGKHSTNYFACKANLNFEIISHIHGKAFEISFNEKRITIIPMYHPAAALYNAKYKKELEHDFQILKQIIKAKSFQSL